MSFLGEGVAFSDFAGSTVVHSVGGWAALMGAIFLGPRIGKYQDGVVNAIPGHNMSIATLGCLILWIGWFGFNPGSELAADLAVPQIALVTNLAAAAGGLGATFTAWSLSGKPDLSMVINGILAGLVGITAGCGGIGYWGAVIVGLIAGIIVVFSVGFFDSIKIDDPVGATSVHLVCGIWGTLAVGLFDGSSGLFFGGGVTQLIAQIVGIVAVGLFTRRGHWHSLGDNQVPHRSTGYFRGRAQGLGYRRAWHGSLQWFPLRIQATWAASSSSCRLLARDYVRRLIRKRPAINVDRRPFCITAP